MFCKTGNIINQGRYYIHSVQQCTVNNYSVFDRQHRLINSSLVRESRRKEKKFSLDSFHQLEFLHAYIHRTSFVL